MNSRFDFRPGDVVSVRFGGVLRHYGIVTYGGRVISNTRRHDGVVSQSLEAFARGRAVKWHGPGEAGSEFLSLERAHRRLGNDYHLTGSNCVHFVRSAHGRKPTVTQVARASVETVRDLLGGAKRRY